MHPASSCLPPPGPPSGKSEAVLTCEINIIGQCLLAGSNVLWYSTQLLNFDVFGVWLGSIEPGERKDQPGELSKVSTSPHSEEPRDFRKEGE